MVSEPFFELCELDCARLLQRTACEPSHPVVGDAKRLGYFPMLPDATADRFSGFFDSFFNIHVFRC
jgi:hypothetical protein